MRKLEYGMDSVEWQESESFKESFIYDVQYYTGSGVGF